MYGYYMHEGIANPLGYNSSQYGKVYYDNYGFNFYYTGYGYYEYSVHPNRNNPAVLITVITSLFLLTCFLIGYHWIYLRPKGDRCDDPECEACCNQDPCDNPCHLHKKAPPEPVLVVVHDVQPDQEEQPPR
jgi:hypothetical protein